MKRALLSLLIACSLPAVAQSSRPYQFEPNPGCMWSKNHGTCVVNNKFKAPITCTISITGLTMRGIKLGNTRKVEIGAGRTEGVSVFSPKEDVLIHVNATADCIAE